MQNVSHLISSPVTDSGTTLLAAMEEGGREGGGEGRKEGRSSSKGGAGKKVRLMKRLKGDNGFIFLTR